MSLLSEKKYKNLGEGNRNIKKYQTTGATVVAGYCLLTSLIGLWVTTSVYDSKVDTAVSCIENYVEDDVFDIDRVRGYSSTIDDYCFVEGKYLSSALRKLDIKYCEYLDEYYTEDGRDLVKLTIHVMGKTTARVIDGRTQYFAPSGYTISGIMCYRAITKVVEVNDQDDYSDVVYEIFNDKNEYSDAAYEIANIKRIHTRKYDDIIDYNLVWDVNENEVVSEELYESKLTLRHK